jgi:hypothetical protein
LYDSCAYENAEHNAANKNIIFFMSYPLVWFFDYVILNSNTE